MGGAGSTTSTCTRRDGSDHHHHHHHHDDTVRCLILPALAHPTQTPLGCVILLQLIKRGNLPQHWDAGHAVNYSYFMGAKT